jgi:hypothetical protein
LREAVDGVARLADLLTAQTDLREPGVFYETHGDYAMQLTPAVRSLGFAAALGWCFKFDEEMEAQRPVAALDAAISAISVADLADWSAGPPAESACSIEAKGAPLGAVASWIRLQDIVDAFDAVYDLPDPGRPWSNLAFTCDEMRFNYETAASWAKDQQHPLDMRAQSRHGAIHPPGGLPWVPSLDAGAFWTLARGLCISRLAPDEYRQLRERDRESAAEDRLRTYFFGETWDQLPVRARDSLVAADLGMFSLGGRIESVVNELRIAAEELLYERVWNPLRAWALQNSQAVDFRRVLDQVETESRRVDAQPNLRHISQALKTQSGRRWMDSVGLEIVDSRFLRENVPAVLDRIWGVRNRGEHDLGERALHSNQQDVYQVFAEMVGIGRAGVLAQVARIGREPGS